MSTFCSVRKIFLQIDSFINMWYEEFLYTNFPLYFSILFFLFRTHQFFPFYSCRHKFSGWLSFLLLKGSIGVIASLPNFSERMKREGVDYEEVTAGKICALLIIKFSSRFHFFFIYFNYFFEIVFFFLISCFFSVAFYNLFTSLLSYPFFTWSSTSSVSSSSIFDPSLISLHYFLIIHCLLF